MFWASFPRGGHVAVKPAFVQESNVHRHAVRIIDVLVILYWLRIAEYKRSLRRPTTLYTASAP